jgi:hypothetical protein
MSIDENNYIEAALEGIIEQIDEVHRHGNALWEAYSSGSSAFSDAMNKLEQQLRTVSDSVEIFQNYSGRYDRIGRPCFGGHPWTYEVQCRLCEVQRLCCEETQRLNAKYPERYGEETPICYGGYPGATQIRCLVCPVTQACARRRIEFDELHSKKAERQGD